MVDVFNDFGFTAVTEEELDVVLKTASDLEVKETELMSVQERLDKLYNSILPLLNNLKANSEKSYIYWPNRLEKVEQFEDLLYSVYTGTAS